jgi:Ni/Fe-hydrogenase b-type cytochrome subunit
MTETAAPAEASLVQDVRTEYKEVYLWHWPVRAMHWVAAGCIVVLVVTGFYIGRPYFLTSGAASDHFLMGRVRFAHFVAAGVLVATAILRAYWLFAGNKYERWRALFPFRAQDWSNMGRLIRSYLFIRPEAGPHYLGHNPIQQVTYTLVYVVALLQVTTGFYLYGLSDPGGIFFVAFGWVGSLLGGAQVVRFVHHVLVWFWLIFFPVHLYLTIRSDVLHRGGRVSSMISGHTYVRDDVQLVDE